MGRESIVEQGWGTPRQCILRSLAALSDLEYQRSTWIDPEMKNPHYSYVEFVECFYDSCGGDWRVRDKNAPDAPFKMRFHDGIISSVERDLLWDVHLALAADDREDHYDHAAILASDSWRAVVRTAAEAVSQLRSALGDPIDLNALTNELPSAAAKRWP